MLRLKRLVAIVLSIVLVGIFILSAMLTLLHYDSTIRKYLLREAQLSSKAIDIKNIKSTQGKGTTCTFTIPMLLSAPEDTQ